MRVPAPKIDERTIHDILKKARAIAPFYAPEWKISDEKEAGSALLTINAHILESVISRLNQAPNKNFSAFLDMLGIKLLPAQAARAPLTFKLAAGTDKEIFIPARTQAAAGKTEEHEELPFETETNLLAISSQLKKAISVDPAEDAIFLPPPGFLNGELQKQILLSYKIVSSPAVGAKSLQLDHVTNLKEGDFLKLLGKGDPEYIIISGLSGTIVSMTDGLLYAYPAGTPVEKITHFCLFEGKNMQEHGLYLAHKDLFNVKSTAQFSLDIIHLAGMAIGITPLKLVWQYWGEVAGEKGEDWRPFNTIDATQGLSKSGQVDLHKMAEGEIKEKEINGIKSRWIRCLLKEPLPVDQPRRLPVLDKIEFVVKSSGENLQPDQAFNNDIPLDLTQPFTPFGKEPRMFDRFALASKEIFSKKEAKVEIDVDVEPRGILGPPTAIQVGEKIKVFARGTYGRLFEVEIDPSGKNEPVWTDHGFPPDTKIAAESTPSAVTYKATFVSVFARTENGHLVERYYNGDQWQWVDHGAPKEGVEVSLDPSCIYGSNTVGYETISVFITGTDGSLYEFNRNPDSQTGMWHDHDKPNNKSIDSSPYSFFIDVTIQYEIRIKVFVKCGDGQLYELDIKADKTGRVDNWKTSYGSPNASVKVDSRPFAQTYYYQSDPDEFPSGDYYAKIFVKGTDGKLWEFDTLKKEWISRERPIGVNVDSYPHGYIIHPGTTDEKRHIFVRCTDNFLWERNGTTEQPWVNHQAPPNSKHRFSPFVLDISSQQQSHIFSNSSNYSILERKIDERAGIHKWNEYKDPSETALTPALAWEYWNDNGWVVLRGLKDETNHLLKDGKIAFDLPTDIEETEIAGQKNYWIRARIVGGDYGKESFKFESSLPEGEEAGMTQQLISTKTGIRPPIINRLTISYQLEKKQFPQQCLTYNNLAYLDETEACKSKDKHFPPFVQLDDKNKTLYLGFEKPFKGGPIKLFFAAKELPYSEDRKPKLEWTHSTKDEWGELSHLDATEALIKREILELMMPEGFSAQTRFGQFLYWIKGALTEGEYEAGESPLLNGVYPNTAWAVQAETIKDEILGSSNGEKNQSFSFHKSPVLEGVELRVREMLSDEERQALAAALGKQAIYEKRDERGNVTESWVLWQEVPYFFDSTAQSRHYVLDHASGLIQFGDGMKGMIPPQGVNNIKAFSYQAGGGAQGNVKAGEIKTLKTAVAGVDKVSNPIAADGGADTATPDQMLEIGPTIISHRNRAVTAEDFEWLAKQASRKVVKTRCLPNRNHKKQTERGWVTVIIVPDSPEDRPFPSLELRKVVRRHLEAHAANTITSAKHVHVDGPSYVGVGITAQVVVTSIDVTSTVDSEVKKKLNTFFHPLTGGPEGKGWDFGRDVAASDIYALLESIEGVDHVENLQFTYDGKVSQDIVTVEDHFLVANGKHAINLRLKEEE